MEKTKNSGIVMEWNPQQKQNTSAKKKKNGVALNHHVAANISYL